MRAFDDGYHVPEDFHRDEYRPGAEDIARIPPKRILRTTILSDSGAFKSSELVGREIAFVLIDEVLKTNGYQVIPDNDITKPFRQDSFIFTDGTPLRIASTLVIVFVR